jgi:hypothetical protein
MTRNLKVLGLCVVAVLAMSVMVASAAQAKPLIRAERYTATVSGTQTGENVLSNGVRSVSCKEASLSGLLTEASSTITISPSYSICTGNANTTATVDTTGCDYTLHTEGVTGASTGNGKVTITCEGPGIIIDIWATGKSHSETKLCRLVVPSQGPTAIGEYHNRETAGGLRYVELTLSSSTLIVKRTEGTALNCGAAEKTNATYAGVADATATNEEEEIDLWIE